MYYYPNLFTDSCTYVTNRNKGLTVLMTTYQSIYTIPSYHKVLNQPHSSSHIADMPYQSEKEQIILLSSISNYHWPPTPGISTDKISKDTTSRLDSQMLYYPKHNEDYLESHQYTPRNHLPTSPHLRLLYLTTNLGYEDAKM